MNLKQQLWQHSVVMVVVVGGGGRERGGQSWSHREPSPITVLIITDLWVCYQLLITNTVIVLKLICTHALLCAGRCSEYFPILIT